MSPSPKAKRVSQPCGTDCRFSAPLKEYGADEWGWCTHPARGGLVRPGRDCPWFEVRGKRALPPLEPPGLAADQPAA